MGFDAIWISPPLKNKPGSYHGYHNIDNNLFCFSDFKLWDPEMGGYGIGYPTQRVFNIGVNLEF